MSFGDFNHDGHTSLPEAMYAYGMLEDSDTESEDFHGARNVNTRSDASGCITMMLVFFGAMVLMSVFGSLFG